MRKINILKSLLTLSFISLISSCELPFDINIHFSSEEVHNCSYTHFDKIEPTCSKDGLLEHYECLQCGKFYDASKNEVKLEDLYISKTGHDFVVVKGYDATCTVDGLTDGIQCSKCHIFSKEQEVIKAYGHKEEIMQEIEATCYSTGLTQGIKCSVCNEIIKPQQETPLKDHKYVVDEAKEPTCEENGHTRKTYCEVCNEVFEQAQEIKAIGHDYDSYSIVVAPTLTSGGKAKRVCKNDSTHINQIDIPNLTSSIWAKSIINQATCITKGKAKYTSIYGEVTIETPLVDHDYQWVVDTQATYTTTGLKHEKCVNCEVTRNLNTIIDQITCTHELEKTNKVNPTCESSGKKEYYYCSSCDLYFEDENKQNIISNIDQYGIVDKLEHNYSNWVVTTNPTLNSNGIITRTCQNDSTHKIEENIPALNDSSYKLEKKEPTYSNDGYISYMLEEKGISIKENIPKLTDNCWSATVLNYKDDTNPTRIKYSSTYGDITVELLDVSIDYTNDGIEIISNNNAKVYYKVDDGEFVEGNKVTYSSVCGTHTITIKENINCEDLKLYYTISYEVSKQTTPEIN